MEPATITAGGVLIWLVKNLTPIVSMVLNMGIGIALMLITIVFGMLMLIGAFLIMKFWPKNNSIKVTGDLIEIKTKSSGLRKIKWSEVKTLKTWDYFRMGGNGRHGEYIRYIRIVPKKGKSFVFSRLRMQL